MLPWELLSETFRSWSKELDGDRAAIEAAINHVHLLDVFTTLQTPEELDALADFGRTVATHGGRR